MKKSMTSILFPILLLGFVLTTTNCKKDGDPARDKFLGIYSLVETCLNINDSYDLTIIASGSSDNAVILLNLYQPGAQVNGTVSGNNLTIASQSISSGATVLGAGTISNNTLTINYTITDQSQNSDMCTAVCTRQ